MNLMIDENDIDCLIHTNKIEKVVEIIRNKEIDVVFV